MVRIRREATPAQIKQAEALINAFKPVIEKNKGVEESTIEPTNPEAKEPAEPETNTPEPQLPPLPETNPEPKTEPANLEPNVPTKKLTAAEATEVMAWDIGKWETTGQGMPAGGQPQVIKITMEARWKVEGKSVEYKFTMVQDGKTVSYFGYKEYDVTKGIFIYRSKWGENPETTSHERYDPATRTTHAQTIPPAKTMSTTIIKRVGKDKTQQKLRVFEDVDFARVAESMGCLGIRVERPGEIRGALIDLQIKIQKVNRQNTLLIKQSMKYVDKSLQILAGDGPETGVYAQSGKVSKSGRTVLNEVV